MGGVNLDFAGKGRFLQDHHYAEVYGRDEWLDRGETLADMVGWGLRDDALFRHAKTKLDALEASGQRFNLTLLTLDTHYPGPPVLSDYCRQRGVKNYADLVACTADQVADFVGYIRARGYLKNTDVVVLGDHLPMTNPIDDKLKTIPDPERHIFNLFVGQNAPRKNREQIVHFDLLPTILDFVGVHVSHMRLALGYSGFAPEVPLLANNRLAEMRSNLTHPSPIYFDLWKQANEAHSSAG